MLYYYVYRMNLETVFLLMLCGGVLWAAAAASVGKRFQKTWRVCCGMLMLAALFLILYYTVFRRGISSSGRVVLRPFASFEEAKKKREIYRSLTMNILLFFPIGLFLPQLLPGKWKPWQKMLVTVLAGLLFSAGIETIQYLYKLGDAETDDLITNSIGTFIGALTVPCTAMLEKIGAKR